ncbi:MAG TPA: gliding motility protein, partial [Myxococcaceae bacterium]|nr:gliding motility protein [Myxococcaceae bacterium]
MPHPFRLRVRNPIRNMAAALLALGLGLAACKQEGRAESKPPPGGAPSSPSVGGKVGGAGKPIAPGPAADLRLSPDGSHALYLANAEKPRLQGVPPSMVVGELYEVPVAGGPARKLGSGVTNVPGGALISSDSRWALYLSGYSAANQEGALQAFDLTDPNPSAEPIPLGRAVTYFLPSPDAKWLAFVDGGVLKVGPLGQKSFTDVAGEVSTAEFAPDGSYLVFKRKLPANSGLVYVPIGKWQEQKKLGEQVGDYAVSPDSKRVAFTRRSESVPSTYDLYLASAPKMEPKRVALGAGLFAFSPDSKWLARTEGVKPELLGDLYVGPASG